MSNRKAIGLMTYGRAERELRGTRGGQITLGYQTWLRRVGDTYEVVHFITPILTYHPDGAVICDCSGHRSRTTLSRVREMSGADIFQKKFLWRVGLLDFRDGINLGVPRNEQESLESAAMQGDRVAFAMLKDRQFEKESVGYKPGAKGVIFADEVAKVPPEVTQALEDIILGRESI